MNKTKINGTKDTNPKKSEIARRFRSVMTRLFLAMLVIFFFISIALKDSFKVIGDFNEHYFDIIQLQMQFESGGTYYKLYMDTKDLYYLERFQNNKLGFMNKMNAVKNRVTDQSSIDIVDSIEEYLESYDEQTLAAITGGGYNQAGIAAVTLRINNSITALLRNEMLQSGDSYNSQARDFGATIDLAMFLLTALLLAAFLILYASLSKAFEMLKNISIAIKTSNSGRYKAVIPEYYGDDEVSDIRNFSCETMANANKFYEQDLKEIIATEKSLAETKTELDRISEIEAKEHFAINIVEMRDRIYFEMIRDINIFVKMNRGGDIETLLSEFQTLLEEMYVRRHENKLARELSNLEKYMNFQNSRLGGSVKYICNCRTSAEETDFPNYTLFAIVHNICKTSFDNHRTKGTVKLKIYENFDCLTIAVIDTGYVITEQYPKLYEKFQKGNAVAIKLLESYFQNGVRYKYYSKSGCGNIFTMKIYKKI